MSARRLARTVGVNTPAEAAVAERPLGAGMLAEAAGARTLGEPESALVTSGSVLALVTWEAPVARVTSAAVTAAPGAGSFATEAAPGVEWRNGEGRGIVPTPPPRPAHMQKTNRSGEV